MPGRHVSTDPALENASRGVMLQVAWAGRLLELYATATKPWEAIVDEIGGTPLDPHTGHAMSIRQVRRFAIEHFLSDEEREAAAARMMSELETIAYANMEDYFPKGEDGKRRSDPDQLTRKQMAVVKKLTITTTGEGETAKRVVEMELYSKIDALREIKVVLGLNQQPQDDPEAPGGGKHLHMHFNLPDNGTGQKPPVTIDAKPASAEKVNRPGYRSRAGSRSRRAASGAAD